MLGDVVRKGCDGSAQLRVRSSRSVLRGLKRIMMGSAVDQIKTHNFNSFEILCSLEITGLANEQGDLRFISWREKPETDRQGSLSLLTDLFFSAVKMLRQTLFR